MGADAVGIACPWKWAKSAFSFDVIVVLDEDESASAALYSRVARTMDLFECTLAAAGTGREVVEVSTGCVEVTAELDLAMPFAGRCASLERGTAVLCTGSEGCESGAAPWVCEANSICDLGWCSFCEVM